MSSQNEDISPENSEVCQKAVKMHLNLIINIYSIVI